MSQYKLIPILNVFDSLQVRTIRNQCRLFMTNDTSEIGVLQQIIWYFDKYRHSVKENTLQCFIFTVRNKAVGFGLIKKTDGKYWITGGLRKDQRGKGLGTLLFKEIIAKIPSNDVWLEVLASNIVAQKLYKKLGFKKIKSFTRKKKIIFIMKLKT